MKNKSIKKEVILNLIQDLQRLLLSFINGVRGRFRIKYGMTQLYNLGFTLIELLVVVVIIAVLTAVAVPMYKHAALKSRFSTVMPMAKAIADAQEVYYLGRNMYALGTDELDVAPVSAEGTSVALSKTEGHDYVLASRSGIDANYIIYQQHSENYAGNIYCEAGNEDAEWLCAKNLGGKIQKFSLTPNYKLYLIEGSSLGFPPGYNALLERVDCTEARAQGFTCEYTVDEEHNTATKKICTQVGSYTICRTRTYNEDGSYTSVTCEAKNNGACKSDLRSVTYDANGNLISTRQCYGNRIGSDGNTCTQYNETTGGANYDYTYDANGNMISERRCSAIASNGNCTRYFTGENYDYTYDANGNRTSGRGCKTVASDGTCSEYYDWRIDYTYDANRNQTSKRDCMTVASDGTCSEYGSGDYYTYDANGNQTSERRCNTIESDGTCSAYASWGNYYTYDANRNRTSERRCATIASDGTCSEYDSRSNYDYTYDANGNRTSKRECSTVASDGTCSAYNEAKYYTYDDNGKQMYYRACSGSNLNTSTGECIAYGGAATLFD